MPERYSPREAGVEIGSFLHDYYKQMIEKKEISESALKSTIDPDYKPKGKKLLSNYRTTKIAEGFIKANKKDYPFLKHIRTSPDTESCMWLDGKNPVAVVVVRKESEIYTWITSIDIFPRYRGYGLSYQVLDYATKKMGANCLTVAKDNEIAKKVYDKYGFRELIMDPKERHSDKVTYMALPGTLKESAYMNPQSVVYFTRDISPESLVKIYEALGVDLPGKVMVKISSGEPGGHHFLSPDLIAPLVKKVNGTICDANTAYEGKRHRTRDHRQTMHDHGFDAIAPTDILDATGDKAVPVRNGYHLEEVRIGNQTDLYDSVLVLSHFKGHAMAGFGGALKNVAIGMASAAGKALVHTAGKSDKTIEGPQQDFLRSMVDSVSGITSYIGKDKFVYINIANNLSVDCDCDAHPAPPTMEDIGIFASTDPVAVDQACIDAVYFAEDSKDLIAHIKRQTGLNILKYAAEHGIGSRRYQIVDLDRPQNESFAPCERLKDAIDNIFSHNALVQLWTPVIHDTNGERYNYKLWDGEAWKIPEEYLDLDILSIDDIADDEHLGYINIIIDSDYVPMEESAKNEKLYPVYITLFSNDTNFGKLIRKATGSEYSHATVALDPTMNNMYSFSDIPYNEAKFFCAGFVRESIWSPEYTKNRHFRVLVTFVDKVGKDKIQKKIDHFINNFEKYNYNDIGLVQYYFKFKNTKKHDETKKMRWFCSEFVSAMVNASDETEGFENILASPQDLLRKPNVIDLGKFTIPEFNEEELVRKTRAAEKEFRKHANLSKSVVNESVDEWLYELIDESALNEIFNKAKSKKPKFDERQVQKYTFNLDWKLLYEKFKELFPKNDPSMRFDLFGVIVRYFLIPTKAAAVNVTQQIIDQMVKIASFVKNGFIKLIDAVSSLIFFQGEDGDDVMRYPDGPMHEATNTINEIVNSKVDFKDIHKIVDNLSPKEKKWLYNGSTFKDSPYVVYRDIQYKNVLDKKHGGFLEAYIFPKEKNNIYVSIVVDKESRRLGIADLLMNRFMLVIQAFCPNKTVIWKVKPDNIASIKLAQKMGFADISDLKNPDQYKYEMVLNEAAKSSLKVNTSLYFISKDRLDESEIIHPRIPDDYMTQHGYEDNKTPRVCFSTSIDGCLTALGMNVSNQKFYVYHPISDAKVITPTEEQVPDASITKERWICEPVQLHYIGAIKAIDTNGPHDDGTPYRYGKNKEFEARLYHWGWKWLNRPAVSRNISESASIPATLYHGSPKTFKVARVHDSGTSGAHLFATSMRSFALAYAGAEWSDFEINQSRVNGDMCLTEILPGKFREVFSRPGYLHILPADTFKSFHGVEFISDEDVRVQKTYKISNVLKELQKAPDVKLYYYPDLPPFIQDRERYLRDMAIKYNHNIDKILAMTKELRVEVKESTNPNDGQSSKAVKLTFYLGNDKVGEAGVSGYDTGAGFLYDLEVVERFRGKGYSKQILDYVMKNYSVTDLSVAADNKVAINLYEKFGFKLKKTFNSNGENGYEKGRFRWYQLDESAGVINEMAYEDYCDCFYAKLKSLAAQYNKRDDIFKHVAKVLKMEQKDLPKFDCHIQVSGEKQLCFSLVNSDTSFEIRCEYEKYLKEMIEDLEKDVDIKTKCPHIKSIWTADAEGTIYVNLDYEHINEAIADTHSLDREQKKRIADKYGLRQGGYGQRTSKEDEDRMKKSAEWEKKIPLKQRKKIYREDGHPEELIPSHEEVRDPVDDCLPIAETAAVADDTKGDGNNFHNGNKLIHWYDGWTADGCQFDLEGVAEGEPGAYRFEVDIDSQDEWMGTIHNLNNPDKSLITEAMERVLVDPTNKAMVQKYRDLGYEFIPGVKNRGKAQPMFKTDRSKPDKLYPVYVVLFYSGTALGKLIKAAAGPHFSHAAISFTENLTEMYSFGRKSGLNVEAFVVDSIENEAYQRPDTQYAIYMVPATAEQYDRMKERIQWFIKNAAKFKYNFSGLFKNYLGISDNPKYRYFCSQFVADILNVADPSKPYFADPSLVTPENFIYTTFAQYVVSGPLSEFDPNHVKKISQLLLARETKNRNATFKNESASIPYSNPLTIRFTNDKIPIVTKSHFNRISTIYNGAEKVINNADSDDRLVTDTMCELTYAIEIMDRYLTKGLGKKDELYRDMIQLRSKILKLVMKGHKRMMTSSENYNFQEIYDKSKYAEVPTASTVIGEELRTLL